MIRKTLLLFLAFPLLLFCCKDDRKAKKSRKGKLYKELVNYDTLFLVQKFDSYPSERQPNKDTSINYRFTYVTDVYDEFISWDGVLFHRQTSQTMGEYTIGRNSSSFHLRPNVTDSVHLSKMPILKYLMDQYGLIGMTYRNKLGNFTRFRFRDKLVLIKDPTYDHFIFNDSKWEEIAKKEGVLVNDSVMVIPRELHPVQRKVLEGR